MKSKKTYCQDCRHYSDNGDDCPNKWNSGYTHEQTIMMLRTLVGILNAASNPQKKMKIGKHKVGVVSSKWLIDTIMETLEKTSK